MKRNVTIQLDEDVIREAKAVASRRGTSVSGLVSTYLQRLAAEDEQYEQARKYALQLMDDATDRGGWKWNREEIYAERLDRYGQST